MAYLKLLIARLKRDKYGASSERGRKLIDQLERELGELVAAASEDATKAEDAAKEGCGRRPDQPARGQPVRAPLPGHLPRERVVLAAPTACSRCGGKLSKLGEDVTETLEVEPIRWKVIQTVRERFSCRSCEAVTQPPGPFHPIARGQPGPNLLATMLEAKFGQHQPLNRQSDAYAFRGIELSVSTIAAWVGTCTANPASLMGLIDAHVLAAERLHGDEWAHLFGAVRPTTGDGFALVLPEVSTAAMQVFLDHFAPPMRHLMGALRRCGPTWPSAGGFRRHRVRVPPP